MSYVETWGQSPKVASFIPNHSEHAKYCKVHDRLSNGDRWCWCDYDEVTKDNVIKVVVDTYIIEMDDQ